MKNIRSLLLISVVVLMGFGPLESLRQSNRPVTVAQDYELVLSRRDD